MSRLAVGSGGVALASETVSEWTRVVSLGHWKMALARGVAEMEPVVWS